MAKNSAVNLDITNNADGFDISGGTTKRKITITGVNITLNSTQFILGSNTYTMPSSTDTIVGRSSTDTLTNKTLTSPIINVGSDATGDMYYRDSSGNFTRIAVGTNGQYLSSDGTKPVWGGLSVHSQNTDTGTTSSSFQIDSGNTGPKFKNSSGEVQLRNSGDTAYADIRVKNLYVEGTTTTINATTVTVDDKNIELGSVDTPTDTTADGGGITLKGATDKTISWVNSTSAWTLSEHVNIASGKEYRINGTKVLDATSLGSAVVSSSLTSVGTIATGTWNATNISLSKGGTNASLTAVNGGVVYSGSSALAITAAGTSGYVLQSNGASAPTWVNKGYGEIWSEITTTTATAVINNDYICNNASTRIVVTLPATAALGSKVRIAGKGSAGWQVTAPTGDAIIYGNVSTPAAGYIQSTHQYDTVELVCIIADSTWLVVSAVGNIYVSE